MKVKWLGLGVAGGNGLLQYVLADQDAKAVPPRTEPFKRWADWAGAGGVVLGLAMHFLDFMPDFAEPILYSSLPRAEAAGIDWGRKATGGVAASVPAAYRQPVRALPMPSGVPTPVSRSYQPEFEGILAI